MFEGGDHRRRQNTFKKNPSCYQLSAQSGLAFGKPGPACDVDILAVMRAGLEH